MDGNGMGGGMDAGGKKAVGEAERMPAGGRARYLEAAFPRSPRSNFTALRLRYFEGT